jgi:uncharacterized protein YegL
MEQIPFGDDDFHIPFGTDDFAENPEPRLPCMLLLDVSSSMHGEPISELNEGLIEYKNELSADSLATKRVEVSVITFGSQVETVSDWSTATNFSPPTLKASGMTPMGQAVTKAMESIASRKHEYRENGVSYYRPWLFIISDGAPNDADWQSVASEAVAAEKKKAFKTFCVGVQGAELSILGRFCEGKPLMLRGLRFRDLFQWLSASQRAVSRSTPGDDVPLDNPTTPDGWASIA